MSISNSIKDAVANAPVGTVFRASDFLGSRSAVDTALFRLAAANQLVNPRRGVYFKPQPSRFGPVGPSAIDVARAIGANRGIGPTGWSASNALGISTQVPPVPSLVIIGAPPKGIDGVRFHSRNNISRAGLGYLDIALLEVLRAWPRFVEADWDTLVTKVRLLSRDGRLDLDKINSAASHERRADLVTRIQALIAAIGTGEDLGATA